MRECLNLKQNQGGRKAKKDNQSSQFHLVDNEVYGIFVKMRSKGRKVSASWIQITAKRVFDRRRAEHPNQWEGVSFDASYGWMCHFLTRRNFKFQKRKCGKEKTAKDCIVDFQNFLEKLRFEFLPPREEDSDKMSESIWGRFPPQTATIWIRFHHRL